MGLMPHRSANGSALDGGGFTMWKSPCRILARSDGVNAGYVSPPIRHLMLSHEISNLPNMA
eukprot:5201030-Prymnesium_polylepis.1